MRLLNSIELFQICAADTGNSDAWNELLRRYSSRIRYFIAGTLRQLAASSGFSLPVGIQESDLFQNAIMRLVSNECAAMKRFSGRDENDLLAYLAVICRSSVVDTLRRSGAVKRTAEYDSSGTETEVSSSGFQQRAGVEEFERRILIRELVSFARNTESESGQPSDRDHVVFDLHFFHGLSFSQISQCKGINLSKAGVEKVLKRMIARVQTLAAAGKPDETVL